MQSVVRNVSQRSELEREMEEDDNMVYDEECLMSPVSDDGHEMGLDLELEDEVESLRAATAARINAAGPGPAVDHFPRSHSCMDSKMGGPGGAIMTGFYFHPNSEPYQQLSLRHIPAATSYFEFR